jgi:hypothetical protein
VLLCYLCSEISTKDKHRKGLRGATTALATLKAFQAWQPLMQLLSESIPLEVIEQGRADLGGLCPFNSPGGDCDFFATFCLQTSVPNESARRDQSMLQLHGEVSLALLLSPPNERDPKAKALALSKGELSTRGEDSERVAEARVNSRFAFHTQRLSTVERGASTSRSGYLSLSARSLSLYIYIIYV